MEQRAKKGWLNNMSDNGRNKMMLWVIGALWAALLTGGGYYIQEVKSDITFMREQISDLKSAIASGSNVNERIRRNENDITEIRAWMRNHEEWGRDAHAKVIQQLARIETLLEQNKNKR